MNTQFILHIEIFQNRTTKIYELIHNCYQQLPFFIPKPKHLGGFTQHLRRSTQFTKKPLFHLKCSPTKRSKPQNPPTFHTSPIS